MPLGDHAAHWANYLGELVMELPLHYPSRRQMPPERKAGVVEKIRRVPVADHIFFLTLTVGGVFLNPEDKALYDEMLRLQGLGSNTPTGQGTVIPLLSQSTHSADIARLKKHEKLLTKQVNMFMRLFRSDDKFSQMLAQLESQPAAGVAGVGMMSQEMMRTATRMRRRRTIVRRCGVNIDLYLADNGSFMTSSPVL
nr:hypothetical protein [Tanacetum cinerariifolium]